MPYKNITLTVEDQIATLTISRPAKLNALDRATCREIAEGIRSLHGDDGVKVLVLTGAGRAFCAGADLSDEKKATDRHQPGLSRDVNLYPFVSLGWATAQIDSFTKPVIAAVNGPAVGAGLSYALAADIRIASDRAKFSSIFIKRGLVPDAGISYYLPRLVGISRAIELMWTGDIIDAAEADRIGLVNRVVPHDSLMPTVMDLARRLADGPSLAIEMTKRMAYSSPKADSVTTQMAIECCMQDVAGKSEDYKEGVKAFLEKREPRFKGK